MKNLFSCVVSCVQIYLVARHRKAAKAQKGCGNSQSCGIYSRVATIRSVAFIQGNTVYIGHINGYSKTTKKQSSFLKFEQ